MTDQSSPITPPPELRDRWRREASRSYDACDWPRRGVCREDWLMDRAAQWGSDQRGAINEAQLQERAEQELEACCEWLNQSPYGASLAVNGVIEQLRAARRPKPPSLKEQALKRLKALEKLAEACGHAPDDIILHALEQLND